jgi:hypothetical protein
MTLCTEWVKRFPSTYTVRDRRRSSQWRREFTRTVYANVPRQLDLSARAQEVLGSHGVARVHTGSLGSVNSGRTRMGGISEAAARQYP